jgi:hypothetical protein
MDLDRAGPGPDIGDLRSLLSDPWVTDQKVHRAGDDWIYVRVSDLREVAIGRFPESDDIDKLLDALVDRAGGERVEVVDPWQAIANVFRRLRGTPVAHGDPLYAIPRAEG